ncbi:MAG: hypothetical protein MZV70_42005 [Desulfobacterales bacterium]|nr:hypothetical protein [Desulfobacterales bacterium]
MVIDEAGFIPGKTLILGSDGMPHGIEAALRNSLFPPFPQQRLTLEEFIAGYCMPDEKSGYIEFEITDNQITDLYLSESHHNEIKIFSECPLTRLATNVEKSF